MRQISISVDLRHLFGPARNQGARPTCAAFAVSDAHAARRGAWAPLSCEYAFYHAQRRASRPPTMGASLTSLLDVLREDGQPAESGWPYLASLPANVAHWVPPVGIGALFGRNGQGMPHKLDPIIQKLNEGQPVILLSMLSTSFYQPDPQAVVDPVVGEMPDPEVRHAIIAVGHGSVDGQRALLARNSWGPKWGDAGHGWLTERFLDSRLYNAAILLEEIDVSTDPVTA